MMNYLWLDIYHGGINVWHFSKSETYQREVQALMKSRSAHLHDIEEHFLPQAVLAFEELVLRVGAGDVPTD